MCLHGLIVLAQLNVPLGENFGGKLLWTNFSVRSTGEAVPSMFSTDQREKADLDSTPGVLAVTSDGQER
jgi:hypothetical protein